MPSFPLELKAIAKKEKCLVLISTGENGTTTPNGNINVDCEIGLELTIQPDEGYKLRDILVNGKNKNSEVIENKFNIKDIQGKFVTVTATFEKIKYKVDIEIIGNGRVESEHDLNDIEYGENVILNLISDSTHEVKEVYVDDTLYNLEDLKIELNEIKSNIKIKIIFDEIKKEQITVEKGGFSCSKKENSSGGLFDFMFTMFSIILFMFIKRKIYK
jgi:hypothetical protein